MSKDQYYDSKEERDDKKSAEKNFADMLNTQFNMNELFNRYSDYDYSASPNIPKEDHKYRRRQPGFNEPDQKIPEINPYESPFEPRWPYQRTTLPPYQNPYRQKTQEEVDAENAFNDQMADVLRRFEEQQRIERQADLRQLDEIGKLFGGSKNLKKEERKSLMKAAFIKLISERIDFDENDNLIDLDGNVVKSIGQFGLMFIRILNSVLESKKTATQNENDLKDLLK